MSEYYYLNDDHSTRPSTLQEWGDQRNDMYQNDSKHIADIDVDGYRVSTVWLGIDHRFSDKGLPLLFETMVFHGDNYGNELYIDRYSTWAEAEEGHKTAVEWVKHGCKD